MPKKRSDDTKPQRRDPAATRRKLLTAARREFASSGLAGARAEAERRGIPFLGEIPLDAQIRQTSDEGRPIVATEPDSAHARHYIDIGREVWAAISSGAASRPAPRIVME